MCHTWSNRLTYDKQLKTTFKAGRGTAPLQYLDVRCYWQPVIAVKMGSHPSLMLGPCWCAEKALQITSNQGNPRFSCFKNTWAPKDTWLVVWNMFYFFHILGIIGPTDSYIFQRGRYTTNQIRYGHVLTEDCQMLGFRVPCQIPGSRHFCMRVSEKSGTLKPTGLS